MEKDTNSTKPCYACGQQHPVESMRPFGSAPSGRVLTWVCRGCSSPRQVVGGKPLLAWPTIATAVKLAERGVGDSADHVMRKALALLEREMLARKL